MSGKKYSVRYSALAKTDLKDIYSYIAFELKARATARAQTDRIRQEIKALDTLPERYQIVDWEPWQQMNVRRVSVDNFVVFYRVSRNEKVVEIVRIVYRNRPNCLWW